MLRGYTKRSDWKMKKQFIVEIEVDEKNIQKKYPNYKYNYSCPRQMIKNLINDFVYEGNEDMSKVGLRKWGYAKRIIKEVK